MFYDDTPAATTPPADETEPKEKEMNADDDDDTDETPAA